MSTTPWAAGEASGSPTISHATTLFGSVERAEEVEVRAWSVEREDGLVALPVIERAEHVLGRPGPVGRDGGVAVVASAQKLTLTPTGMVSSSWSKRLSSISTR